MNDTPRTSLPGKAGRFGRTYATALCGCAYLFAGGFLFDRHRKLLRSIRDHFSPPPPENDAPILSLPGISLAELFCSGREITLLEPEGVDGNVSVVELNAIAVLIRSARASAIFEIGTFDGRSALNMIANASPDCRLYTLDLPPEDLGSTRFAVDQNDAKYIDKKASGARFHATPFAPRIVQLFGDSASFDFTAYEGRMDVVFVDGSHAYDYACSDTRVALRLVKPEGGWIIWHDYSSPWWPGVTRALNEAFAGLPELRQMKHLRGTTLAFAPVGGDRARSQSPR